MGNSQSRFREVAAQKKRLKTQILLAQATVKLTYKNKLRSFDH